jgi:hypothetical protein
MRESIPVCASLMHASANLPEVAHPTTQNGRAETALQKYSTQLAKNANSLSEVGRKTCELCMGGFRN